MTPRPLARRRRWPVCIGLAALATSGSACTRATPAATGSLVVAAAFAPLEDVVRGVTVGTDVIVVPVVPHGEVAHEFEPTAQQLDALSSARLVVLLRGFQPSVDAAARTLDAGVVDLFTDIPLLRSPDGVADPHIWLDPQNMALMATTVASALSQIDPARSDTWTTNAASYAARMTALDAELTTGLSSCASRLLITGHEAFGYLAAAYGLRHIAIAGLSPSDEPSAADIETLADLARSEGVTTIFFERGEPDDLSATLADEVDAGTAPLDPFEALSDEQFAAGDDYGAIMRSNLETLRLGLECP